MTREEAANILDPETTLEAYAKISYYGGFEGESAWQDAVNEACRMGAAALRTQQDQCGLTNEQLGRLVSNSYAEGYEDCKAGKPPLEKRANDPLTNADRIRTMSDEDLANFLTGFSWLAEIGGKVCYKTIADWLQQPAEAKHGCDFAKKMGFSSCDKCPIDCDIRQMPVKEETK